MVFSLLQTSTRFDSRRNSTLCIKVASKFMGGSEETYLAGANPANQFRRQLFAMHKNNIFVVMIKQQYLSMRMNTTYLRRGGVRRFIVEDPLMKMIPPLWILGRLEDGLQVGTLHQGMKNFFFTLFKPWNFVTRNSHFSSGFLWFEELLLLAKKLENYERKERNEKASSIVALV
ncbi:uncharacterized protein LOC131594846 [Vicia villosa]|uniref:uncharacterized protein LOC131594846 n=1 Tax=Vicia villosa TaxID=3911 RepID=UPI00273BC4B8|nr:uncharacterized protein LOC131594846 [Vicia villosa]